MRNLSGRIRPLALAAILIVAGIIWENWLWKVGGIIVLAVFVEAFYRYRAPSE